MRDSVSNISPAAAVVPAVLTATNTSSPIDLRGFGSAAVIVSTGAIAGDGDYTAKVQESDTTTSGDFTDVTADDLIGTLPATLEASTLYSVGYRGHKRYLRTVVTKNSGTSIALSAAVWRGLPRIAPVA